MTDLHGVLAYGVAATALLMLVVSLATSLLGGSMRVWLDRAILLALAALLVAALGGLPLLILNGMPTDPLHLLYAVVAPAVLLAARYLGRRVTTRRRGLYMVVGSLALLGVVYRLFTTVLGSP